MEIERKYLIEKEQLPKNLSDYPFHRIEQGYLCTSPVVRIRRQDDEYFLTYKSKGLMAREEYNLPLTQEAYEHLKPKADGLVISKTRYLIPEKDGLTIELDVFHDDYEGLLLAEVEFPSEDAANAYTAPAWFGRDVTFSSDYHNSTLSKAGDNYSFSSTFSSLFISACFLTGSMRHIVILCHQKLSDGKQDCDRDHTDQCL